jgi:hypothetical protein
MTKLKDQMVGLVEDNAKQNIADLTGKYICAKSEEKEALLAGVEFERWLVESCRVCLQQ